MIQIEHVSKTFSGKYGTVHALDDVSIHVEKGDICGIIGFSGAGKSTLIRLVNGLETADSGKVTVCGKELSTLKKPELRALRRKIGMVFQQFNLLESKTVYHNIALPLILAKTPKVEIDKKVKEVLKIVELEDKKDTYISQLSGGQKQRVGIARALTTDPELLLCDEATSALDPQTTESILKLLKKINRKMGVTILLITHQMQVVQMQQGSGHGERKDRGIRQRSGGLWIPEDAGDKAVRPDGYPGPDPGQHHKPREGTERKLPCGPSEIYRFQREAPGNLRYLQDKGCRGQHPRRGGTGAGGQRHVRLHLTAHRR